MTIITTTADEYIVIFRITTLSSINKWKMYRYEQSSVYCDKFPNSQSHMIEAQLVHEHLKGKHNLSFMLST